MGKIGKQLLFKLWPTTSGNHGHFDATEKIVKQYRHFGIERRLTFGERSVQVKNN